MSGRRRRVGESDEDNDDYVEIEEGDEVIERMPGTQLPGNGEGPSQTQAEKSQEQDSQTQRPKKKQKRASDGDYVDGSIVRVHMRNFLTYDDCTVYPGPKLNMLIGPNGTGKSSLIAAIIVGVGGGAGITGRFKELKELVKRGKEKASVEVELKKGSSNIVIRREWKKDSNSSKFYLNGETSTAAAVEEKIKKYQIQVDNLCQVLPQDRVGAFSAMNAQELLKETQRAAGGEKMVMAHEKLMNLNKEVKEIQMQMETLEKEIEHDENRNRGIELEVQRLQELETFKAELEIVQLKILMHKYQSAFDANEKLRKEYQALNARKLELEAKNGPLVEEQTRIETDLKAAKKASGAAGNRFNEITQKVKQLQDAAESKEKERDKARKSVKAAKDEAKALQNKLPNMRKELEKLQHEYEQLLEELGDSGVPLDGDSGKASGAYGELLKEIDGVNGQLNEVSLKLDELERNASFKDERDGYRAEQDRIDREIRSLEDIKLRRMGQLARSDRDTAQAMDWIKNQGSQNVLKETTYDPIMIEMNAKEMKHAKLIENLVPRPAQRMICCKSKHDYDILSRQLLDVLKLKVNIAQIDPDDNMGNYPRLWNDNELRRHGFEGWAIDCFDAPEPIKAYLCKQYNLHQVPYTLSKPSKEQMDRVEAKFSRYVVQDILYRVTSAHGQSVARSGSMQDASWLTQGADEGRIAKLKEDRAKFERKLQEIEGMAQSHFKEKEKYAKKQRDLNAKKVELMAKRNEMRKIRDKVVSKGQARDTKQKGINTAEKQLQDLEKTKENLIKKQTELMEGRFKTLKKVHGMLKDIVDVELYQHTTTLLKETMLQAQLEEMKRQIEEASKELAEVTQQTEAKRAEQKNARAMAKAAHEVLTEAKERIGQERAAEIGVDAFKISQDQLEDDESRLKAKIDAGRNIDRSVLDEYNRRKESLESKREAVASFKNKLQEKTDLMSALRNGWYPKVTELIGKINESFDKHFKHIGCVGEVTLMEEGSYEQWGIRIAVKFREAESLQQLSAQRHSGGEKAVSTISYLMALQSLANVPIKMVDEINQGMDPRNERLVHSSFVRVSCEEDGAQFFLVTPKLLADLRYHEKMRVLVVMNGDHLAPEDVDFSQILEKKRKLLGRAA